MALKAMAALLVVAVLAAAGLAIYGAQVKPVQRSYEQVLPDDRFPN
jgi:hypothetical protein